MTGHVKVSSAWKQLESIHVRVGGVWKQVSSASVRVAGTWKEWFVNTVLSGGNGGSVSRVDSSAPFNTSVLIRFNTDGSVETGTVINGGATAWSSAGDWIDPTAAISGNEEVRFTNLVQNIGSTDWTTEAAADDTWIGITTTRTWISNKTNSGSRDFDCDFEVRDTGAGLDTGTASYSFLILNTV